jgi:hypothetical protein
MDDPESRVFHTDGFLLITEGDRVVACSGIPGLLPDDIRIAEIAMRLVNSNIPNAFVEYIWRAASKDEVPHG